MLSRYFANLVNQFTKFIGSHGTLKREWRPTPKIISPKITPPKIVSPKESFHLKSVHLIFISPKKLLRVVIPKGSTKWRFWKVTSLDRPLFTTILQMRRNLLFLMFSLFFMNFFVMLAQLFSQKICHFNFKF
jgi:hypothetical protein